MPSLPWGSDRSLKTFLSPMAQSSSTCSESKYRLCLPVHCYLPPHNSGPIYGVQCRDSRNQNLRIHRSNSPRSLGGQWKRSPLLPRICPPLWRILNLCQQLHDRPSPVLLVPLGPFSTIGVQAWICSLLAHSCKALPSGCNIRSAFVSLWGGQTTGFLKMQRTIQQLIYRNLLENKLALHASWTFLPNSAVDEQKTMNTDCVTLTDLTKVSKDIVQTTIMCHTQMLTGVHRLKINFAYFILFNFAYFIIFIFILCYI